MRRFAPLFALLGLSACYESSVTPDASGAEPDTGLLDDAGVDAAEDAAFDWTPPLPFDGAVPPDDPGPGVMRYRVEGLDLGTDANTGFDLDGFDTRSFNDPVGCGILDGTDGVDNRLQSLVSLAGTFGFDLGSILFGIDLGLTIEIRGYEGLEEDWIRADILAGSDLVAEDAPGLVRDGVAEIHFEELRLPVVPGIGGGIVLPLALVRVRFDLEAPDSAQALLGGALVWDDGTESDLQSLVQLFIANFGGGNFPVALIQTVIVNNLDVAFDGPGSACNGISLAAFVEVERLE